MQNVRVISVVSELNPAYYSVLDFADYSNYEMIER